jgi:hypothetical protein
MTWGRRHGTPFHNDVDDLDPGNGSQHCSTLMTDAPSQCASRATTWPQTPFHPSMIQGQAEGGWVG